MKKSFSFFDFDGTLIHGDSFILFAEYALKTHRCSFFDFLRCAFAGFLWWLGCYSEKQSKEVALRFLIKLSEKERGALIKNFCRDCLKPKLFPEGIEEMKRKRNQGDVIVIVSASPLFYLLELRSVLPVDRILATEYDFHSGQMIGKNCKGQAKVEAIQKMLDANGEELDDDRSSGYGDSSSDAPMLKLCHYKYGVNAKKGLREQFSEDSSFATKHWRPSGGAE